MQFHANQSSKSFAHGNVPAKDAPHLPFRQVHTCPFCPGSDSSVRRLDGLVEEKRFANVFYLGDSALEVERFR